MQNKRFSTRSEK